MVVANLTKPKRKTSYGIAIASRSDLYNLFLRFKNRKRIGFKSFKSKHWAEIAYRIQSDLASLDLAPRVYGNITRVNVRQGNSRVKSGWGYATEIAPIICKSYSQIEKMKGGWNKWGEDKRQLCDKIQTQTHYDWCDCHDGNVGYVRRKRKLVMVCIDTGGEGFGYGTPTDDEYSDYSCSACRAKRET